MTGRPAAWVSAPTLFGAIILVAVFAASCSPAATESPSASPSSVVAGSPAAPVPPADLAAQNNLRRAAAVANSLFLQFGTYQRATPIGLVAKLQGFTYEPPDQASKGPSDISLLVTQSMWSAAAKSKSGLCFWIRASQGSAIATKYGSGEPCTGSAAQQAAAPAWG